ncbi:hypothetical protein STEG23_022556, partial [Scotinomys teguina]
MPTFYYWNLPSRKLENGITNGVSFPLERGAFQIWQLFQSQRALEKIVNRLWLVAGLATSGLKTESEDSQKDEAYSASGTCGEEFLAGVFQECDTKCTGTVEVDKIMTYLRQTTGQDSEDSVLGKLGMMLDPENTNPCVDLDTFQGIMKEWVAHCRSRREGTRSRWGSSWDGSVFEPQEDVRPEGSFYELLQNFGAWRKEMSDLITCVADLHSNMQKLEEENTTCKLALEAMEEANRQLAEDCTSLHLRMKCAQQDVRRGSLLKEELKDLKVTMAASEEQKTMAVAQSKQLETEIRTLILKIRALQEESIKNVMDIDSLEKKIEEFSETKKECQLYWSCSDRVALTAIDGVALTAISGLLQVADFRALTHGFIQLSFQMQLHMYEDMLLTKDASLQKKDLCIEELESTIMEFKSVIENVREDKNNLNRELQLLEHKLIVNGIQVHEKDVASEGEKSLYHEITLAQTAERVWNRERLLGICNAPRPLPDSDGLIVNVAGLESAERSSVCEALLRSSSATNHSRGKKEAFI